jgi:hypothetical protein
MAVCVDETGDQDAFGAIDNSRIRDGDSGPYVADLAILDQHVCAREVAYGAVEREHNSAFEQNASGSLHACKLRVTRLSECGAGKRRKRSPCGNNAAARFQEIAS